MFVIQIKCEADIEGAIKTGYISKIGGVFHNKKLLHTKSQEKNVF